MMEGLPATEAKIQYLVRVPAKQRTKISDSKTAFNVLKQYYPEESRWQEIAHVLYLDRANKVIWVSKLSEGGLTGTIMDPKVIFMKALKCLAHGIIVCHNHPSGNVKPSEADIQLTHKLIDAGKFLDMAVLDHIIIGEGDNYYSMADSGDI